MKLNVEIEKAVANLTIELNAKEVAPHLESAVKEKIKNLEVDGFRKGKMPKAMFLKKYGISSVYPEAIDIVLNAVYPTLVEKNKLNVIAAPEFKWDTLKIDEKEGFYIKGHVDLMPEIVIENYKDISKKFKKDSVKITKKAIEKEISNLIEHKATIEVKEEEANEGDIVVIDFEGFKDGIAFDGGKGENHSLTLGSNSFIPGFEEQLIGKKAGEKVDVKVTFPADYHAEDLKGAEVEFKCLVHEVKAKKLPKLTAKIIKEIKEFEVSTRAELEEAIKEKLSKQEEEKINSKYHNQIIEELIKMGDVTAPASMIKQETDYTIENFKNQIKQQGIEFEMYIQMMGMTEEMLRKDIDKESERKVQEMLILDSVVKQEDMDITQSEIDEKVEELAKSANMEVEKVLEILGSTDNVSRDMAYEKAYKLILGE